MLKVWFVAPFFLSLLVSYTCIKLLLESDLYSIFIVGAGIIATLGVISLLKTYETGSRRNFKMTSITAHGGVLINRVDETYSTAHIQKGN
ncbi:hypothetical protein GCM10020331_068920 [Ectobacillus funiculus]